METQAISLNVHPQIIDLYEVLEKNGLHKQKEDVQSLVGYIESMEYNLSVMMNEIQEMHAEVNLLHDKGMRAKCAKIVTKAEDKILQVGTMVSVAKGKVVESAGAAVKAFKEKRQIGAGTGCGEYADSRRPFQNQKRLFPCSAVYAPVRRAD